MAFDEERYRREVLDAGLPLTEDLRRRYQLPQHLTVSEVDAAVQAVRACWRRQNRRIAYREVIAALEGGHTVHQPLFEAARGGNLVPLQHAIAEQERRAKEAHQRLKTTLLEASAGQSLITEETLRWIRSALGVSTTHIDDALAELKITVDIPDALPLELPHSAYVRCRRHLDVLQLRHLADFLMAKGPGARSPVQVRPFTGPGFTEQDVRTAAERWGKLPHNAAHTAAQAVVAAIRKILADEGPEGLRSTLCYELAELLRIRRAARLDARSLFRYATDDLSVISTDARRLVFAVVHEEAADPVTARLRPLIADGRFAEAVRVLGRFPRDQVPSAAEALASHVRDAVTDAHRLCDRAARVGVSDPELAWQLLEGAEALVTDLPRIAEVRRGLAGRPVPQVTATAGAAGVLVEWEPTPSTAGRPEYVVVRLEHRRPRSVAEGTPLTPEPGTTSLLDAEVPVNVPVYYGVAVQRAADPNGSLSQLTVSGPARYRPEVQSAVVEEEDGKLIGRWQAPAHAHSVSVVRLSDNNGAGSKAAVAADHRGFTDSGLTNGVAYSYHVKVVYAEDDGSTSTTEGIRLTATPAGPPNAVTTMTIEQVPGNAKLFEACFAPPGSGQVLLYSTDTALPFPTGYHLSPADVENLGTRLPSEPFAKGLRFPLTRRDTVVFAATVAGKWAVLGARRRVVAVPAVSDTAVARERGEAVVTFGWPHDGPGEAEVTWASPGSPPQRRIVTRLGYLNRDGARLPLADSSAVDIEVRLIDRIDGRPVPGPSVRLSLPACVEAGYRIVRRGFAGRSSVRAVVTSDTPVRMAGLLLVGAHGDTWPLAAGDGQTLAELSAVDIGPGRPAVLTARLPRARGLWVRCFAMGDDVVLIDPPTRTLRFGTARAGRRG